MFRILGRIAVTLSIFLAPAAAQTIEAVRQQPAHDSFTIAPPATMSLGGDIAPKLELLIPREGGLANAVVMRSGSKCEPICWMEDKTRWCLGCGGAPGVTMSIKPLLVGMTPLEGSSGKILEMSVRQIDPETVDKETTFEVKLPQ